MPGFPISVKGSAVHSEIWQLRFTLSPSSLSIPGVSPSAANFASIFRYQFLSCLSKSAPELTGWGSGLCPTPGSYPHSRRNRPSHRLCLSRLRFWAARPDSARKPYIVLRPPVPPGARAHANSRHRSPSPAVSTSLCVFGRNALFHLPPAPKPFHPQMPICELVYESTVKWEK